MSPISSGRATSPWSGGSGAIGTDLDGLYVVGRVVTLTSALLGTLGLGVYLGRRYGWGAGLAGAVFSLGTAPMNGFGLMARPDMLADTLGLFGFYLALRPRRVGHLAGLALLVLAVLTKQTAGVYLLAATAALSAEGRWRRAIETLVGGGTVLVLIVAVVTIGFEPNFAASLLAEAGTPSDPNGWRIVLDRLLTIGPDMLYFAAIGLLLWNTGGRQEAAMSALTVVLLVVGVVSSLKRGADLNYYLSLRAVEALAVGTLWHVATTSTTLRGRLGAATLTVLGLAATWPSLLSFATICNARVPQAVYMRGPEGRIIMAFHDRIHRLASDPESQILADYGLADIQQEERTAFGDPWLFRMLVQTGRLDPQVMKDRVEREEYDLVLTRMDLFSPEYATYDFGLPMPVAEAARNHYLSAGSEMGVYVYTPRGTPRTTAAPP